MRWRSFVRHSIVPKLFPSILRPRHFLLITLFSLVACNSSHNSSPSQTSNALAIPHVDADSITSGLSKQAIFLVQADRVNEMKLNGGDVNVCGELRSTEPDAMI